MVMRKGENVNIQFLNRGEQILYEDDSNIVECDFTHCSGHRFFTDSVKYCRKEGRNLSSKERITIVKHIVQWLLGSLDSLILVIDEKDECRRKFENFKILYFSRIVIELDSEEKRQKHQDRILGFKSEYESEE